MGYHGAFDPADNVPEPGFKAPDIMGTVEGWRAWKVAVKLPPFGNPPKLTSATHRAYYWNPRRISVAECDSCGPDVPGENCSCGFYSAKSLPDLMTMGYPWYDGDEYGEFCVLGQVANWGKVIQGSQGWRAAKAYPVRLFVPFEAAYLAKSLGQAYGVPVKLHNWLKPFGYEIDG